MNNPSRLIKIFSLGIAMSFFATVNAQKTLNTIIVDAGHGGKDAGAVGIYDNSLHSKEKDITLAISKKLVAELQKQLPNVKTVATRTTDVYQSPREKAAIANNNNGDLFLCIHADSGPLKTGKRQIGTKTETRYRITHEGKGKKKKTIRTPYEVEVPIYEHYKIPMTRSGTSVYIFGAHKTSDKLAAIMREVGEFEIENDDDSTVSSFNINTPEGKMMAQAYAKRYQEKSNKLAELVNDEVAKTGRNALGVNQRQVGIWVLQATNMPAILVETGFINNPEDEKYMNSEKGQQEMAEVITKAVIAYKNNLEKMNKSTATASN